MRKRLCAAMWSGLIAALAVGWMAANLVADVPAPEFHRLGNGLRLMVLADDALPLVSVQVWYPVGAADDPPGRHGLCQVARTVVEHRREVALRLRAAGLEPRAEARPDACVFATVAPPEFLGYVLALEAERMQADVLTAGVLAEALHAAARERLGEGDDGRVWRGLLRGAFGDDGYGRAADTVAVPMEDVPVEEVSAFLERRFQPAEALVVVVGDVEPVRAQELVGRHFGGLASQPGPPPRAVTWPQAAVVRHEPRAADRTGLDIVWALAARGAFDQAVVRVLLAHLLNSYDGGLYGALREAGANPPRVAVHAWRDALVVHLAVDWRIERRVEDRDPENRATWWGEVERIVGGHLEHAVQAVPSEVAFDRARALAAQALREERRGLAQAALEVGAAEAVHGNAALPDVVRQRVARLHVREMQQAAVDLRAARMVVQPRFARRHATDFDVDESKAQESHRLAPAECVDAAVALELLIRHAADAPAYVPASAPPEVQTTVVIPQVTAHVCRVRGAAEVAVWTMLDADGDLSELVIALVAVGSELHEVDTLRDYLTYHGLEITPLLAAGRYGLRGRGPSDRAAALVELHAELVRAPRRDSETLQRALDAIGRTLELRAGWPADFAREEYSVPDGLLGWNSLASPAARERTDLEHGLEAARSIQAVRVVVVGDVEPDEAIAAIRASWDGWWPEVAPAATAPAVMGIRGGDHGTEVAPVTDRCQMGFEAASDDGPPTGASWVVADRPGRDLFIDERLAPPTGSTAAWLPARRTAYWLFGVPVDRAPVLDGRRQWAWQWLGEERESAVFFSVCPSGDLQATFGPALERREQLHKGRVPATQLAAARRLAQLDQVLRLDDADRIAEAIAAGVTEPWRFDLPTDPVALQRVLQEAYDVRIRYLCGEGSVDLRGELEALIGPVTSRPARSPPD